MAIQSPARIDGLAEHRLAERISAYGRPLRFLGAPRADEGGKGVAVAAEIVVGLHVLALTRAKTGVLGTQLLEIDPIGYAPKGPATPTLVVGDDLRDVAEALGADRVAVLVRMLSQAIASTDDRPRAIELTGAIAQLFETGGFPVDPVTSHTLKQPGLSTGLLHQFGTTDRA